MVRRKLSKAVEDLAQVAQHQREVGSFLDALRKVLHKCNNPEDEDLELVEQQDLRGSFRKSLSSSSSRRSNRGWKGVAAEGISTPDPA